MFPAIVGPVAVRAWTKEKVEIKSKIVQNRASLSLFWRILNLY